ncbi:hypothetical protein BZA77DRAFT_317989 [Pyronema omphalodes]|nr:hypothetical protein BZA77DRAFT_317989 [Pyronema omphalodes]
MQSQSPLKGTEGTSTVFDSSAIQNCAPSHQERPGPQQQTPHSGPGYFSYGTQKDELSTPRQRAVNDSSRVQKTSSSSSSLTMSQRLIARLNLAVYKMYTNQTDIPFNNLLSLPQNLPRPTTEPHRPSVPGYRNYDQHHPDYSYSDYNYYPTYNPDYPETYNPHGGRYVRYPIAHPSGWVKADRKKKGLPTNLTDPLLEVIPADPPQNITLYPPPNKPVNTPVITPYFPNPDAVDLSPSYPAYGPQHWESPMQCSPYPRRPSFDIHQPGRRDSYERRHSISQRRQSVPHIPTIPEVGQGNGDADSRRMSSGNIHSGKEGINGTNSHKGINGTNNSPRKFSNTQNLFESSKTSKTTQEERESTEAWLIRKEREANYRATLPAPLGPTGPSPRIPAGTLPTTSPKRISGPFASPSQQTSPGQKVSPKQFAPPGQSTLFKSPSKSLTSPNRQPLQSGPFTSPNQFASPRQPNHSPSRGPPPKAPPPLLPPSQSALPSSFSSHASIFTPTSRNQHDVPAPGLELLADMSTAPISTLPTPKNTPETTPGTGHAVLMESLEERIEGLDGVKEGTKEKIQGRRKSEDAEKEEGLAGV